MWKDLSELEQNIKVAKFCGWKRCDTEDECYYRGELDVKNNFILRYMDDKSDEEKIVFDIIFDLMHAFFHVSDDPNYDDYHWALYGNLKDRVEIGEYD